MILVFDVVDDENERSAGVLFQLYCNGMFGVLFGVRCLFRGALSDGIFPIVSFLS